MVELAERLQNPSGPLKRLLAHGRPVPRVPRPTLACRPQQLQVRLTSEQEAELVARYRDGALRMELATSYRIHKTTVTDIIGRHEARRIRGLTDAEVSRAVEMYGTGASLVDVGKAFGVNATTIRNYLIKFGATRRDSQGRPT